MLGGLNYYPATISDSFVFEGEDISEKRYKGFLRELKRLEKNEWQTG